MPLFFFCMKQKNTVKIFPGNVFIHTAHLLGLLLCGGSAEKVKVNLEPCVDAGVNRVVLVADLLRCQALFSGFVLCSCPILICATHKQHVPASKTAISRKGSGEKQTTMIKTYIKLKKQASRNTH